jgi:hypothetical protein
MESLRSIGVGIGLATVTAIASLAACSDGAGGAGGTGTTSSTTSSSKSTGAGQGSPCSIATDCAGGLVCIAGKCGAEGSVPAGGPCSASRDCTAGLYCSEIGVCAPGGSGKVGDACSSGGDCAPDLACILSGLSGTCASAGAGDLGQACAATTDCLAGLVCGPGGTCQTVIGAYPPYAGATCAPDEMPFRVLWEVPRPQKQLADFYRLPFPNDARVADDGTLDLSDFPRPGPSLLGVDLVDLYANALSQDFDGFSTVAPVTFRFSNELDLTTVDTHLHYVDVTDPVSPAFGTEQPVLYYSYDLGRGKFVCQQSFAVYNDPSLPLSPKHTYAVFLTTGIRGKGGETPTVDPDLTAVLGATQPVDATLAKAWTKYAGFRQYLTTSAIDPSTVAGVAVFTTADPTAKAKRLAQAVTAAGLPTVSDLTLCDGNTTSPCDGDGDRHCGSSSGSYWEIHGRFHEPSYQQGTLPYEKPADGGGVAFDGGGNPVQQGSLPVCFALTIPKSAAPASGFPLVVHAHGTGGSFRSAISNGIADVVSTGATPMATLTFEGVAHGARRGTSTRTPDSLVFNVVNPRAARDNHLQGEMDVLEALRIPQVSLPAVTGVGAIRLDPAKTYFFGHSQGSTVGVPAVALSGDVRAAIFSGAGSDLTQAILKKTSPSNAKAGLSLLLGEPISDVHPVVVLWQTFFERIDPLAFDALVLRAPPTGVPSKHVFMTASATDTYTPEATLTITAKIMGLEQAEPVIDPIAGATVDPRPVSNAVQGGDAIARTAALFQYASDGSYDGHFVSTKNASAVADWSAFLSSLAATGVPTVP